MPTVVKKAKSSGNDASTTSTDKDSEVVHVDRPTVPQSEWPEYRYYPVDEEWQRQACSLLGLQFVQQFQ